MAGMSCSPDYCSPNFDSRPGAGLMGEVVGVADGTLEFWLKMASNYPSLLSRNVAEKSQDAPEQGAYMVLGVRCSRKNLSVTLLDCPLEFAVVKEGARCCCRPA